MIERPPKLDPKLVTKRMIELQTRFRVLKRAAWAHGDRALIIPTKAWDEDSKLPNGATAYSLVLDNSGWKIVAQIAARAIIPDNPLYTAESNEEILQKYANLVKDHIHLVDGMFITGFEVEEDFVLNNSDPDLTGSVLTVTLCALPNSKVLVSNIVVQINNIAKIPELDLVPQ